MNELLRRIHDGVVQGDRRGILDRMQEAMHASVSPRAILDVMTQAMTEVGDLFEAGEYFVPEMLIAARTMQDAMQVLKPRLVETGAGSAGIIVAGTVQGDLHEIGKNLVCMMLDCAGFTVMDLGMDVSPERFVQAVREHHPDILALSALLTTTMPNMNATIEALREADLRQTVKVMIGGAPVTEEYAQNSGADGYSRDASQAVKMARSFLPVR